MRGFPRDCAQRPLPSMMMAMCRGKGWLASLLHADASGEPGLNGFLFFKRFSEVTQTLYSFWAFARLLRRGAVETYVESEQAHKYQQ